MDDVKEYVINELTIESYQLLAEMSEEHVALKDDKLSWFQNIITKAEEANDQGRVLAATVVMKAYAEEELTQSFDIDRLYQRVVSSIRDMVSQ